MSATCLLAVEIPEDLALWLSDWSIDLELSVDATLILILEQQRQRIAKFTTNSRNKTHKTLQRQT